MGGNRFRDPIHGFIEVSDLEKKIIDSAPFQRLRNIKQLALTHLVYHGAEHSRFGHSIGVMHMISEAFDNAARNGTYAFSDEKKRWYRQILRIIALTHDLGHPPFSHAGEIPGFKHEDYSERIVKETVIGEYIREIGAGLARDIGSEYDITPDLVCDIYAGRNPGENSEFTFLKTFMDSELDCDKMDYLLRDSHYCGVNYGRYDSARLLSCLLAYKSEDNSPKLAVASGGVQAFEEFVLARYFMFTQVYYHKTRRYFDMMLKLALNDILPKGFPRKISAYLEWDEHRVMEMIRASCKQSVSCDKIYHRVVHPCVYSTPVHASSSEVSTFRLVKRELEEKFGKRFFGDSAMKMAHHIPRRTNVDDEHAVIIVNRDTGRVSTISDESNIIKSLTEPIELFRLYADPEIGREAKEFVKGIRRKMQ